jgi:hypothetical protein
MWFQTVDAGNVIFYGDKNLDYLPLKATTKLESDIKKLQDTHGLTMKIIIL